MNETQELATLSFELKQHWSVGEFANFLDNVNSFYTLSLNLMAGRPPSPGGHDSMHFPAPWGTVPDGYPELRVKRIHINSPGSLDLIGLGKAIEQVRLFLNSVGSVFERHVLSRKERQLQMQKIENENNAALFELQKTQELHKQELEERALANEEKKLDVEKKRALQKLQIEAESQKLRSEILETLNDRRFQKEAHQAMLDSLPFLTQTVIGDKTLLSSIHPISLPYNSSSVSPEPGQGPSVAQYLQVPLGLKLIRFAGMLASGDIKVADTKTDSKDAAD